MQSSLNSQRKQAAFVISLDFELHWGVRDHYSVHSPYRHNLLGVREAIPQMLDLFEEFEVAATWATVGFLFAQSKSELRDYFPRFRPYYKNKFLDPFAEPLGENEADDPLHYAPSLISLVQNCPRQEVGTHTFSHYYCLEEGQTEKNFAADLESAVAIARERGVEVRSLVFPRNQVNRNYLHLLPKYGITNYRGCEKGWMYDPRPQSPIRILRRGFRLLDQYWPVSPTRTVAWEETVEPSGLCNVRGSMFLRPYSRKGQRYESWRLQRICTCMEKAAMGGGIFHLWWHPHNFGADTDRNLNFLRLVLKSFRQLREQYGMRSLSMSDVAGEAGVRSNGLELKESQAVTADQ